MEEAPILVERHAGYRVITLNRPQRLNAFTEAMHLVLRRAIAEAEEGVNGFRVEASLVELSERLRPGMKGVGKTTIEQRLLINIWTHRLVHWLRITLWKWLS